ncbi:MAG: sigma-54-dependent Fis family transcriptional regulator [Candidatus Hydrogenedentes bacterium]|nr:sigma-54-dependent Fis family transcriptional regulator [Candidatus Hydrogenedentota bacterium]
MARVLVVEDEANMRRILAVLLAEDGHEMHEADSLAAARRQLAQKQFDLVLTDQKLGDGQGLTLITELSDSDPGVPVLLITAFATVDLAVSAMRQGAFDFITKPFEAETVLAAVRRAYRHGVLLRENALLKREMKQRELGGADLLGESAAMTQTRRLIAKVAPTDSTVLIRGETGTGKEIAARLIHQHSLRAGKPFITVNCAAMPEHLLESQLFGHERGSFTGADKTRQGLFEAAHGGTLFLDEAGEMPLSLQAKLLRVLMDGEVVRVGANAPRHVDVRILAATHRDLEARVKQELFRADLYYRLAVVPLVMPPLRERGEDLKILIEHFVELASAELKMPRKRVSAAAMEKMCGYGYPGNVRELRNLIERAYIVSADGLIEGNDILLSGGDVASPAVLAAPVEMGLAQCTSLDLRATLERVESELISEALRQSEGNQAKAARSLGISRSDMNYKLKRFGLRDQLPS